MLRAIPLLVVGLLLASVDGLFAQQRLFAVAGFEVVELDPRPSSLGVVIRRFRLGPPSDSAAARDGLSIDPDFFVPFGGGQFLAFLSTAGVSLLDTRTGAIQPFTFPDFFPSRILGSDGNARLVELGTNGSQHAVVLVANARSGDVHYVDLGPQATVGAVTYAAGSDVLFVARPRRQTPFGPTDFFDVDVISARTSDVIKTMDIAPVHAQLLATNWAGTQLFITQLQKGTVTFDVASGAQTASSTEQGLAYGFPGVDERRQRLLVTTDGVEAFSMDSLQSLGKVSVPELPLPTPTGPNTATLTRELDFSGQSATMFMLLGVLVGYNYYPHTCYDSQLVALDADTGQARATVSTTAVLGGDACQADLVRITEPAQPTGFSAEASGARVALSWEVAKDATAYEIEAGTAPGVKNLVTIPVVDTRLSVGSVPPGVYYLRVRAINTIGTSAPSQEIRLVVQ